MLVFDQKPTVTPRLFSPVGLHRAGEVLVDEGPAERRDHVALVRVPGRAGAEVAHDLALVVDAEQLVEGQVLRVVNGLEAVARGVRGAQRAGAGRPGQGHGARGEEAGRNGGGRNPLGVPLDGPHFGQSLRY